MAPGPNGLAAERELSKGALMEIAAGDYGSQKV